MFSGLKIQFDIAFRNFTDCLQVLVVSWKLRFVIGIIIIVWFHISFQSFINIRRFIDTVIMIIIKFERFSYRISNFGWIQTLFLWIFKSLSLWISTLSSDSDFLKMTKKSKNWGHVIDGFLRTTDFWIRFTESDEPLQLRLLFTVFTWCFNFVKSILLKNLSITLP